MIEEIVLQYLNKALNVPVYMEIPQSTSSDSFVIIEKTGGSRENYINSATFALQSYAETKYLAATLNEKVKAAMDRIIELNSILKSEYNTDYDYTDTTKKKYRYQAVYDLVY